MPLVQSLATLMFVTLFLSTVSPSHAGEPLAVKPYFHAISVADVDQSVQWYSDVLGFTITREMDLEERGIRIRLLHGPGGLLEMIENGDSSPLSSFDSSLERRWMGHGVFKTGFVVDDLDQAIARLEELAVPLRGDVITEPDGSSRSIQIEDPDGNIIQIFEITSETQGNTSQN